MVIWAVVLAAGESRRMGRPKLLLPYGEETIIEKVVRKVVASKVDGTVVVLGAERERMEEKVRPFAVKTIFNREYGSGMFSSVLCGLGALPRAARAAVLVLADQPGIPTEVIDRLVDAFRMRKRGLVVPVYRKRRGHPLLLDLKYHREVAALSPEVGLRGLLRSHPEDILEVRVSNPGILRDIDSPEDYQREGGARAGDHSALRSKRGDV